MSVSVEGFKARFTEFATVADSRVQLFLDDSALEIDTDTWGVYYDRGVYYLAAHLLSIGTKSASGASGTVAVATRKKVGEIEIEYSELSGSDYVADSGYMQSTIYGQEWLRLYNLVCPFTPAVLVV